jgi:hypothetical protein
VLYLKPVGRVTVALRSEAVQLLPTVLVLDMVALKYEGFGLQTVIE